MFQLWVVIFFSSPGKKKELERVNVFCVHAAQFNFVVVGKRD
jgi:hypothetical protein